MDDAGAGRHHPEVAKSLLAPVQHGVAFTVARHLQADVDPQRLGIGGLVHLDTVVDDQIHRDEGVHGGRIAAVSGEGGTHRRQVDQGGHTGEILKNNSAGHEGNCGGTDGTGPPAGQVVDILAARQSLRKITKQVFQEDAHGVGQSFDGTVAEAFQCLDRKNGVVFTARLAVLSGD